MLNITRLVVVFAFLSCDLILAEEHSGFRLTIDVSGAKPGTGDAIFSLFTQENYLKNPMVNKTVSIDALGEAQLIIENLSAGTYAVSVIYDENSDGKLNTGLFRVPTEKIGMSNNVKGRFGPPSFKKSSFVFSEPTTLKILLSKAKQ